MRFENEAVVDTCNWYESALLDGCQRKFVLVATSVASSVGKVNKVGSGTGIIVKIVSVYVGLIFALTTICVALAVLLVSSLF